MRLWLRLSSFGSKRDSLIDLKGKDTRMTELDKDLLYWIWLSKQLGVASKYIVGLLDRFEDAFDIYSADRETLAGLSGFMSERIIEKLADKNLADASEILKTCEEKDIRVIRIGGDGYPKRLMTIQDPPTVLYVRGTLPDFDGEPCVGIVGTRKISEYGCRAAYKRSNELSRAGIITISGMALGVDGIVAVAALKATAPTVAVLGTGIDVVYPTKHQKIYDSLLKHGTVISEYEPGMPGASYTFPKRNRIISGLSQVTFVVEATQSSGAMITARDAIVQGRELYALPGNVGSVNSNGTNLLIRNGAHPVFGSTDIANAFKGFYSNKINFEELKNEDPAYDAKALAEYDILPDTYGKILSEEDQNKPGVISGKVKKDAPKKQRKQEKKKTAVSEVSNAETEKKSNKDKTAKEYETLDGKLRTVYDAIPDGDAVTLDRIKIEGLPVGEILASLTLLEMKGLIKSMPGGVYTRT